MMGFGGRPLVPSVVGLWLVAALVAVPMVSGCQSAGEPTAPPVTREPPGMLTLRLWLSFDDLPLGELNEYQAITDKTGSGNTGHLELPDPIGEAPVPTAIARSDGRAVRFSGPCEKGPGCERAVIVVPDAAELSPGSQDFSFGADVLIKQSDLREGSNIVQKGFSTGPGGQWKIQVDDSRGFPSCVLVDSQSANQVRLLGSATVADGDWHTVVCERTGRQVSILVDGAVVGTAKSTEVLDIANTSPVRIGGKHTTTDGDFLFGDVDEVFLRVDG